MKKALDFLVDYMFTSEEQKDDSVKKGIPGYLITSTALANVEKEDEIFKDKKYPDIETVIKQMYKNSHDSNDLGVVIAIHGYNTGSSNIIRRNQNKDNDEIIEGFWKKSFQKINTFINKKTNKKINDQTKDEIKDDVWKNWYKELNTFINHDDVISKKSKNLVFLGYRWPSETVKAFNFISSLSTLPFLLNNLLWGSLIIGLISLLLFLKLSTPLFIFPMIFATFLCTLPFLLYNKLWGSLIVGLISVFFSLRLSFPLFFLRLSSPLFIFFIILATFGFTLVFTLIILRVIVYFRDTYRATHYAVNDLVELIRKIDQGLIKCRIADVNCDIAEAVKYWEKKRVKLSFIGHSMGGYVTTQVVRIISDIFDIDSIEDLTDENTDKDPSSKIGRVFSLGRLILVSPDIPVLTITSGRSNFLRSSLRRFEEAYLFSNEGDLALRVASTAANYFSFPASSRKQGYRLGNVNIRLKNQLSSKKNKNKKKYGIYNLEELSNHFKDLSNKNELLNNSSNKISSLNNYLELNMLNETHSQEIDPTNRKMGSRQNKNKIVEQEIGRSIENEESISDFFTYFDCTEYKDITQDRKRDDKEHNVMILDKLIPPFNFCDYVKLSLAYLAYTTKNQLFCGYARDVHGGYFKGEFSQKLIYRLAFVGFQKFLDTFTDSKSPDLNPDFAKRCEALNKLNEYIKSKQIKTLLSLERYMVDVMDEDHKKIRTKMLCGSQGLISRTFEEKQKHQ